MLFRFGVLYLNRKVKVKNNKEMGYMKKRILAVAGLLVTLTTGLAFTSIASSDKGWELRGNDWYYLNSNGEQVTETWKPNDSNTHKFYLGEDGKMYVDKLFEVNDYWYYVNEDGAQITNQWRLLETEEDDEERWFYFDGSGRAYKEGWKTIGDKRYHFTESKMDYGWLDEEGQMLDDENEAAWKSGVYYCGTNATGWRYDEEWLEIDSWDEEEYPDYEEMWVYFASNGKKDVGKTRVVGNKRYAFDEYGAMVQQWYGSATPSNADYKYYNNPSGTQARGGWFVAVPSEDQNPEMYEDYEERKFYANGSGTLYKDAVKTIGGKKYLFDSVGIMRYGFVILDSDKHIVRIIAEKEEDYPSVSEIKAAAGEGDLWYFTEDGANKTGKFNIELDSERVAMRFEKAGPAVHGIKDGYLYHNGILIKANKDDDGKYMQYTLDGKDYLVNTSGKVQKAGTYNDTDYNWVVAGDGETGYTITRNMK